MDTVIGWIAGGLGVFMLITLIKYAKFINTYPHEVEKARQDKLADDRNAGKNKGDGKSANG